MTTTRIAAMALIATFATGARGQGIIDTFETWQFVEVPYEDLASAATSDPAPEAIGGERDLRVDRVGGTMDSLFGDVALNAANAVTLSCGPGVVANCHLVYDGADASDAINYVGLGGVDLTEGGAYNAIQFAVTSDLGATVTIRVYQDATHCSEALVQIPADPTFAFVDLLVGMADFQAIGPDGGADFTQVGAIEFEIGNGPAGSDISVRIIGTVYDPQFEPPPPPPTDPPTYFCQKTIGYWKTHTDVWPVTSLQLGSKTYTQDQLLGLLWSPTCGNASLILAHQLIAAKLNLAAGSNPADITDDVTAADALLAAFSGFLPFNVPKCSPARQQMIDVAATLDAYNNACHTGDCSGGCSGDSKGGCDKDGKGGSHKDGKGGCDKDRKGDSHKGGKGGCDKGGKDGGGKSSPDRKGAAKGGCSR